MNIWLLQTGEPLPIKKDVRNMRTSIIAQKLLARGHNVFWWASAFEHQQKAMVAGSDRNFDISEKYTIRVLRGCRYRKNVSLARYFDHLLVAFKFRIQSKKYPKPDAMIISMPDHILAYEAARYAVKNAIPFIVDIRDLWPDIFLDRFKDMELYSVGKIALALDFAKLTFLLKNADSLVAVSKGYLNWGLHKIDRAKSPFDKVFYHGYKNSNVRNQINENKSFGISDLLKGNEYQKIFVFVGTFGVSYELELIVEAARYFSKLARTDICFVLAGTGEKSDLINEKAAGLQNVILPGWIGEKEINVLLKMGFAGLVPCKSVENTMPNKPFEYLSAGLPLINSLKGEMVDLIDTHGFGLNYLPGDLDGLCLCIARLSDNVKLHDKMSKKALDFFEKSGDADTIYDEYAGHVERLVEKKDMHSF